MNKIYRVADYLMDRVAELGIRDVFLLPGGGAMYLNDAIACQAQLNPIPCHHEQACGIAAEAYGRTSEVGFGVAVVTTGPGATNIVTPVAGAWIESLPLLVIAGQVKRSDALHGRTLRQSGVQEVDIISLIKSVTKYAGTISRPEDVRKCLEEALWYMKHGRPGPVWLDVPLDVQAAPIKPSALAGFEPNEEAAISLGEGVKQLNDFLSTSKRPLILAGHGIRISGGAKIFRQLVEKLGIPCVFTWNAADLLFWDHPQYVGRPGVVAARAPNFAVQNCDCLISIGCRLDNVVTAYNPKGLARAARKVVIDVDSHELGKHEFTIDLKICVDAKRFLLAWEAGAAPPGEWAEWQRKCHDWKLRYPPLDGRTFKDNQTLSHFQFVSSISDVIAKNRLIVTGSSGLAVEAFYAAFRNKQGQRMFLTSGLGAMGYGLPAAIGACLGAKKAPTVCIESDGSLMLNLQELATLKALNLPITVIIMNNNGYASIRNTQRAYFHGRYVASQVAAGLFIPDIVAVAQAMGIAAKRILHAEELSRMFDEPGPIVFDVRIQEDEALSPKVSALPQADGSIVSMPLEDMSPLLPRDVLRKEMIIGLHPASEKVDV